MTELLLRLFTKGRGDLSDPAVRSAVGKLSGATGVVCNLLLTALKLAAGLLAGSVAVVADGVNNLTDAASSVMTLLGFSLARRPADEDHPYGHARYEYLSTLAVAAVILLVGAGLVRSSVLRIVHPEPVAVSWLTGGALAVSVGMKIWMTGFYKAVGGRIDSGTLRAAAVDSRNDALATCAVLLGCVISRLFGVQLDGWLGLGVAAFILWSGTRLFREAVSPLLGKKPDGALTERIRQLALEREQVMGVHELMIHDYGPGQCYASMHVEMDVSAADALAAHEIIDSIENEALEKLNVHLVIHYDPVTETAED